MSLTSVTYVLILQAPKLHWHLCADGNRYQKLWHWYINLPTRTRAVNLLSTEQMTTLLIADVSHHTAHPVQSLQDLFKKFVMATQTRMMVGLPGLLQLAADNLRGSLAASLPQTNEECR